MEPLYLVDLFPVLDAKLIEVLRSLSADDWNKLATPRWSVKELASHLFDSNVRRLSMARDGYFGESFSGNSYQDLVDFLHRLNAEWVTAMRRLSPKVLIPLLESSNRELVDYFRTLDPHGPASFAVSWAGEEKSENWFDIAREYTEKWHHQQQIREATGRDSILTPHLYFPVLDTFLRALPHGYREIDARPGTEIAVHIPGEAGGSWLLTRTDAAWYLSRSMSRAAAAEITIPQELAWKLFTKGLPEGAAHPSIVTSGNRELIAPFFHTLAIIG